MKPTSRPAGLDGPARALREAIGAHGFVRRDLARRALFVSDWPRRADSGVARGIRQALSDQGWQFRLEGGLALMDWPLAGYQRFLDSLDASCGTAQGANAGLLRIYRRHPAVLTEDMLAQARLAILLWDAGEAGMLTELAGRALAVSLRRKEPVPAFFAPLLASL